MTGRLIFALSLIAIVMAPQALTANVTSKNSDSQSERWQQYVAQCAPTDPSRCDPS